MPKSGKLTAEEIKERTDRLEADRIRRYNDPRLVAQREWIMTAFKGDKEAICNLAATMWLQLSDLHEENEELVDKLNQIHRNAYYLAESTKMEGYIKLNVARMTLEHEANDPASLSFLSGLSVSKSLKGQSDARKRHAENHAMKKDVFDWLDFNMPAGKSLDSIAESIPGKVVPVTFRTARKWVGEWKKLRSAGTP
jgi:hypothetical protein